jgi:hypothetical protein
MPDTVSNDVPAGSVVPDDGAIRGRNFVLAYSFRKWQTDEAQTVEVGR